jgi:hypothetical protein
MARRRFLENRPGSLSALHINGVKNNNKRVNDISPSICYLYVLLLRVGILIGMALIVNEIKGDD